MHLINWGACVLPVTDQAGKVIGNDTYLTLQCLPYLFEGIINLLILFVGTACVVFIIMAGFKFMTSQGDAKQIDAARKTLTFAIIGLVVVLMSFLFITFISYITGIQCLKTLNWGSGCTQ